MSSYCEFAIGNPIHASYHDTEYGFPVTSENVLLERLALEISQAGLSWEIVLKKRAGIFSAFKGFDLDTVAHFKQRDVERLLKNPDIIRNRLKVESIISNAQTILAMQPDGGFKGWLDQHHPMNRQAWTKLFKKTFRFTGGEIVNEMLMSTGYLPGTHHERCPAYTRIAALKPAWMQVAPSVFEIS